jgi:two-component system, OmpR family, response regulator
LKSNNRPRVLCVDDDEDFRKMLSTLLKFLRIEAKAVATAAQALWLIEAERFDLYLLEAFLPDLDGFELCRQMRAADPHTPILFFSGAAYTADKQKGVEAGANAYLVKPDVDGLVERIAQLITPAKSVAARANRRPLLHWPSTERTSVLRA